MDSKKSTPPCPWGAPATGLAWGSPLPVKQDSLTNSPQPNPAHRSCEGTPNTFNNNNNNGNDSYHTPNHSMNNSFRNQRSSPYQHRPNSNRMGLSSLGGGSPHFQDRSPSFSPRNFQPRPRFNHNNNGRPHTPGGSYRPRFDNNNSPNGGFRPRSPYTPSPRQGFSNDRRSFTPGSRHQGHNNASTNMSDYVHTSMLEDPWRNLPAVPLLRTY